MLFLLKDCHLIYPKQSRNELLTVVPHNYQLVAFDISLLKSDHLADVMVAITVVLLNSLRSVVSDEVFSIC